MTTRGYTGHEMVDDFGIIHMNGRIYDPRIGRFLQADPFIQAASNTQSYNRYSYVMNNPLNSTDPSGYFSLRQFVGVIVEAVLCYAAQCSGSTKVLTWAGIGAASGAAQAAANGGNVLLGAITGFFAGGLGGMGGWQGFVASATFGGATSYMMGGKFGHGFISAGVSSLVPSTKNFMADLAIKSAIGGTVSKMTGGKFANGAASAALAYAMPWAASKYGAGGSQLQQEVGASASENSGDTLVEPEPALTSLNRAKSALQATTLSEKTLLNLKHGFGVSPGDARFNEVVSALITNIDNTITAMNSANYLPANTEGLEKVMINGSGFTSEQIHFQSSKIDPTAAAFVFAGDTNKNIFLRDFFIIKMIFVEPTHLCMRRPTFILMA